MSVDRLLALAALIVAIASLFLSGGLPLLTIAVILLALSVLL